MRLITLHTVILTLLLADARADDPVEAPYPEPRPTIRFVDENGTPLAGVQTGYVARIQGYDEKQGADWEFRYELRSNAQGIVQFRQAAKYRHLIFARHPERGLIAVTMLSEEPYNHPLTIRMHPGCHVTWHIRNEELEQTQQGIGDVRGVVGFEHLVALWTYSDSQTLHFFLPPGEFKLIALGDRISPTHRNIAIEKGQQALSIDAPVVPKPGAVLVGKPAPEITDVTAWKNSPPIKLTDLHGKVVLLDFWGWWCGPCVAEGIPELMKLHEEYSRKDLVIIGIHTPHGEGDEVNSVEELTEQLAEIRRTQWNGKELPFPVAITRYRKLRFFPNGEPIARTRMCVDYGVTAYPTCIVIDRQGNVWGTMDARSEKDRAKLRELIKGE